MRLLSSDPRVKSYFRDVGGFVYVLSTLVTLVRSDDATQQHSGVCVFVCVCVCVCV
jgi:hypothetical protein